MAITRVKFVYLIDACVLRRKLNRRFHNKRRRRGLCRDCVTMAPSQASELIDSAPQLPFDQVVMDYFIFKGYKYSLFVNIQRMGNNCENRCTYGTPNEIATDGGPPFNSYEFKMFSEKWDRRKMVQNSERKVYRFANTG